MTPQDYFSLKEYLAEWSAEHRRVHEADRLRHARELELSDAKFISVNNFREQLDQERIDFLTRREHALLIDRVNIIESGRSDFITRQYHESLLSRVSALENYQANMEGRVVMIGAFIGIFSIGASIFLHFI